MQPGIRMRACLNLCHDASRAHLGSRTSNPFVYFRRHDWEYRRQSSEHSSERSSCRMQESCPDDQHFPTDTESWIGRCLYFSFLLFLRYPHAPQSFDPIQTLDIFIASHATAQDTITQLGVCLLQQQIPLGMWLEQKKKKKTIVKKCIGHASTALLQNGTQFRNRWLVRAGSAGFLHAIARPVLWAAFFGRCNDSMHFLLWLRELKCYKCFSKNSKLQTRLWLRKPFRAP